MDRQYPQYRQPKLHRPLAEVALFSHAGCGMHQVCQGVDERNYWCSEDCLEIVTQILRKRAKCSVADSATLQTCQLHHSLQS